MAASWRPSPMIKRRLYFADVELLRRVAGMTSRKDGQGCMPVQRALLDFLDRNADTLSGNHRLAQIYASWQRWTITRRRPIARARVFLQKLDAARAFDHRHALREGCTDAENGQEAISHEDMRSLRAPFVWRGSGENLE